MDRLSSSAVSVSDAEFSLIQSAIAGCTKSAVQLHKDDIRIIPHDGRHYIIFGAFEDSAGQLSGQFMSEYSDLIRQPHKAANDENIHLDGSPLDLDESRDSAMRDFSRANWLAIDEYRRGDSTIASSLGMKIHPIFDQFEHVNLIRVELNSRDYVLEI